jgi:hypothetical protein
MKLPELTSAPVGRLALPEPGVAAAGANAARQGLGALTQLANAQAERQMAADYTDRMAQITNFDVDVSSEILDKPYMAVDELPDTVEVRPGMIENRYDEETDTIREFVRTHEVADSYYQSRMNDFIGEQVEGSDNSVVGQRIKADAMSKIVASRREGLLRYSMEQAEFHAKAVFEVSKEALIQAGDEQGALELIARTSALTGISAEQEIAELGKEIDEVYFTKQITRADTREELQSIRDEMVEKPWRFDADTEDSLYTAAVNKEAALYTVEQKQFALESGARTNELFLPAQMGQMSEEQLKEVKHLFTPGDYKVLLNAVYAGETAYRTPSVVRGMWESTIEGVENGAYPPGIESWEDAQDWLTETLNRHAFAVDPVSGEVVQKMAGADYLQFSNRIQALEDRSFKKEEYKQTVRRINTLVGDASAAAFAAFPAEEQAEMRLAIDSAKSALDAHMREEGPKADPVKWAEDNLKFYVRNAAQVKLMNLPKQYVDHFVFADDGRVDYVKTITPLVELLKTLPQGDPRRGETRAAMKAVDDYRREWKENVR